MRSFRKLLHGSPDTSTTTCRELRLSVRLTPAPWEKGPLSKSGHSLAEKFSIGPQGTREARPSMDQTCHSPGRVSGALYDYLGEFVRLAEAVFVSGKS
ncbi:hypothetical protein E2C01_009395 [Portunus trituberculatus]|uniref:Uncharacterized protein n=1 Tax=Portunus trituberculatus TaxID=210409 RepID=A0A5B7D5I7_PORTR|nr:hypothetical protein [Portunus trituberculatus]